MSDQQRGQTLQMSILNKQISIGALIVALAMASAIIYFSHFASNPPDKNGPVGTVVVVTFYVSVLVAFPLLWEWFND